MNYQQKLDGEKPNQCSTKLFALSMIYRANEEVAPDWAGYIGPHSTADVLK